MPQPVFSGDFIQHHFLSMESDRTTKKQLQKQRTEFHFLLGVAEQLTRGK